MRLSRKERKRVDVCIRGFEPPTVEVPAQEVLESYRAFSAPILQTPETHMVVIDDKSPLDSWIMSKVGLAHRIRKELEMGAWEQKEFSVDEAELGTRVAMVEALPHRFAFLSDRIWKWKKSITPTVYISVKSKCWTTGPKKCKKAGLACFRKIVFLRKHVWKRTHPQSP